MKNTFTLVSVILLSACTVFNAIAQSSGVRFESVNEPGVEKNGQTINVSATEYQVGLYFIMKNVSGSTQDYKWERVRESLSNPDASDELCDNWQCYTPSMIGDNWILNTTFPLEADAQTVFEPKLSFPESTGGNATFSYYVLNAAGERLDSIIINFTSTASLKNEADLSSARVYPNPSNGQVSIKDAPVGSTLEITDMVGKVVLKTKLSGTNQSVDLSTNPDGVYFYTIKTADSAQSITKRLVLRK